MMSNNILQKLNERDNLLSKAKKKNNDADWKHRVARNQVVNMIEKAKRDYFNTTIKENKGIPKRFGNLQCL